MDSEENAILLARYLIEDNNEEYIIFDEYRISEIDPVKNIFKKFIGPYELLTPEKEEIMIDSISQVINIKNKQK